MLSILSPSPATLITPTPEAFFAFFALLGHLLLTLDRGLMAALAFAAATAFRANGVILAGFIIWHYIGKIQKVSSSSAAVITTALLFAKAAIHTVIVFIPFVLYQAFAYDRFCMALPTSAAPHWCKSLFVYTHVQSHYWNVGAFRYWTLEQFPNWLLASPILVIASRWSMQYFFTHDRKAAAGARLCGIPLSPLDAHVLYTLVVITLLVVSSHVQIALRFATPGALPMFWLALAEELEKRQWQTTPLVLWNVVSLVLYSGFYPPA